jgi:hypothetical protein
MLHSRLQQDGLERQLAKERESGALLEEQVYVQVVCSDTSGKPSMCD